MDPATRNGLQSKDYDVRKKMALSFEPTRESFRLTRGEPARPRHSECSLTPVCRTHPSVRDLAAARTPESEQKLRAIITELVTLARTKQPSGSTTATNSRSGGIMGLASLA